MSSNPSARLEGREAAVAAGGATLLATAWILPELWARGYQPIPQCLFHQVTGVPCPFCGGTRSFAAMAHGNLGAAAHVFPVGPLMFTALVIAVVYALWVLASGRRVHVVLDDRLRRALVLAAGAVLLVNWASKIFILGY